jgi:hypothetical protein
MVTMEECKHKLKKIYFRDQEGKKRSWIKVEGKLFCSECENLFDLVTTKAIKLESKDLGTTKTIKLSQERSKKNE